MVPIAVTMPINVVQAVNVVKNAQTLRVLIKSLHDQKVASSLALSLAHAQKIVAHAAILVQRRAMLSHANEIVQIAQNLALIVSSLQAVTIAHVLAANYAKTASL